jgi:hypothetical protein
VHGSITPVNITAAALIAQFCLLGIMLAAALFMRFGESRSPFWREGPNSSAYPWYIAVAALVTIGALLFTDQLSNLWKPLFGETGWVGFNWSTGIATAFTVDLLIVTLLVYESGGSSSSPFNPLYSLMLVLAIFLREPLSRIGYYLVAVITLLSLTFFMENEGANRVGGSQRRQAYWFVTVCSVILATYIGMITQR